MKEQWHSSWELLHSNQKKGNNLFFLTSLGALILPEIRLRKTLNEVKRGELDSEKNPIEVFTEVIKSL